MVTITVEYGTLKLEFNYVKKINNKYIFTKINKWYIINLYSGIY